MFANFHTILYLHFVQVGKFTNGTHIIKEMKEFGEIKPKIHGFFFVYAEHAIFPPHDVTLLRQNILTDNLPQS